MWRKNCSWCKTFVQDAKKRKEPHTYKVQREPNRHKRQNTVGKSRAQKLYTQMLTKPHCLIMGDETYVKADFRQLPGLLFFTAHHKLDALEDVRKQKMSRFNIKSMIWQAICSCGKRRTPFVTTGMINGQV